MALKSYKPTTPGQRGLVLIDPPFEDRDELAHMAEAVMGALAKWPTGTFIFWRSLKNLWAADRFDNGLAEWLIADGHMPARYLAAQGQCLGRAGRVASAAYWAAWADALPVMHQRRPDAARRCERASLLVPRSRVALAAPRVARSRGSRTARRCRGR